MAREDDEGGGAFGRGPAPAARAVELGGDLTTLSAGELEERAGALEAEAARLRAAASAKRAHAAAAGAVFRLPGGGAA